MAGQLSWNRGPKGRRPRLRALPFARTDYALAAHRRGIRESGRTHGGLSTTGASADAAAHAVASHRRRRDSARTPAAELAAAGGLSRDPQLERRKRAHLLAEDRAAPHWSGHAHRLHDI